MLLNYIEVLNESLRVNSPFNPWHGITERYFLQEIDSGFGTNRRKFQRRNISRKDFYVISITSHLLTHLFIDIITFFFIIKYIRINNNFREDISLRKMLHK